MRHITAIIPNRVRRGLKFTAYMIQDCIQFLRGHKRPPRVPSKRHTLIGGGDFIKIGDDLAKTLTVAGLTPDMKILDVGCGQGRVARGLLPHLSQHGEYIGFDILGPAIKWCQQEYVEQENFTFLHADVFNQRYNKNGTTLAKDYKFPAADNQFDFIVLTSVFTHMFDQDIQNYLSEISRTLKPGGQCFITWFILNEHSKTAMKAGKSHFNFKHNVDHVSKTTLKNNPEAAIAFNEDYILDLYKTNGLEINTTPQYGHWATHSSPQFQDVIIATKAL